MYDKIIQYDALLAIDIIFLYMLILKTDDIGFGERFKNSLFLYMLKSIFFNEFIAVKSILRS